MNGHLAVIQQASIRRSHARPVDVHVGQRIRLRRTLLKMSQESLGRFLGLTFQQVQKYETGANRVSASRLADLAHVLDVPIAFFYDDMPEHLAQGQASSFTSRSVVPDPALMFGTELASREETLALVRAFFRIKDVAVRKRVFDLVTALVPR